MSDEADVCVIGAGAGGAVAAWALALKGVKVLLLETGPRFTSAEYATHAPDWESTPSAFRAVSGDPGRKSYTSVRGKPLDPDFEHLTSKSPTMFARKSPRGRRPFLYARAMGLSLV